MSQSSTRNEMIGKLPNVINDESYHYVGIEACLYDNECYVYGLNSDEILALRKRFADSFKPVELINTICFKEQPFSIINGMAELGYRVICSSSMGQTKIFWTLQREL